MIKKFLFPIAFLIEIIIFFGGLFFALFATQGWILLMDLQNILWPMLFMISLTVPVVILIKGGRTKAEVLSFIFFSLLLWVILSLL
jgi:mannitol-specific phosphotransferase system IIBC component